MDGINRQSAVVLRCSSCDGEIASTDKFCRHCGTRLQGGNSPNSNIHERLGAIEQRLVHILVAIGVLLVGWLALQLYHFGRGGFLG